ncbi:50S ribosomal protein L13 [candidate division CSSED10-310 bacterium]|uniref:Large ribosomal subunit protein uL13 n=1 Tax=candidate division CSSED10-310 bacterium TaxID=2855610 RepID=A0ABV6YVV7_UNCC1
MKTYVEKKANIKRKWFIVDAQNQVLGRMSSKVAVILMGKHKPTYQPFLDTGDHVIVTNAEKVKLTGKKLDQKQYYRHSGYPGGIKARSAKKIMQLNPEFIIKHSIGLMLPKNKIGRQMLRKLKVYRGNNHPHQAQQPTNLDITQFQKIEKK